MADKTSITSTKAAKKAAASQVAAKAAKSRKKSREKSHRTAPEPRSDKAAKPALLAG